MRIFKTKAFHRWAIDEKLSDAVLSNAVHEIEHGLYEANLGGSVYKKRLSIGSQGKRGGARTIIAFKLHHKAFFVYGYAKNKRDNITSKEKNALKELAKVYFDYDDRQINQAVQKSELIEVLL